MVATKPLCDLCNSPAKHKCSRCKVIAYCCADHQVKVRSAAWDYVITY